MFEAVFSSDMCMFSDTTTVSTIRVSANSSLSSKVCVIHIFAISSWAILSSPLKFLKVSEFEMIY